MEALENYQAVLNLAIIAIALISIGYTYKLNRKVNAIEQANGQKDKLIANLTDVAERARSELSKVQASAREISEGLEQRIEDAIRASDDIEFLTRKGDVVADRLEGTVGVAGSMTAAQVSYTGTNNGPGRHAGGFSGRVPSSRSRLSATAFRVVSNEADEDAPETQPSAEATAESDHELDSLGLSPAESQMLRAFQSLR